MTAIDAPAANFGTPAFGINSQGDIVGSYTSQACNCGFLLSDRVFTTISPTAPGFSALTGMGIGSNSDIVVGSSLLSGGVFTSIGVPGASVTYSGAINSRGDIAGAYVNAAGIHGFLRDMQSSIAQRRPQAPGSGLYGSSGTKISLHFSSLDLVFPEVWL